MRNALGSLLFLLVSAGGWDGRAQAVGGAGQAAPVAVREQTVELRAGWNAVFLEVDPLDPDPVAVFRGTPVDIAAAHLNAVSEAQFTTNPEVGVMRRTGWNVWYAPGREDSILTNLRAVHGSQAYLLHATADARVVVRGAVTMPEIRWKSDAYNFVGFAVSSSAPPTFAQYFSGSPAHRHNRIFRLVEGVWQRVSDPSAQSMKSGEAVWIYCDGRSRYQGPLHVETPLRRGLVLGERPGQVVLRNMVGHPIVPLLEHVATGSPALPVSIMIRSVGDPRLPVHDTTVSRPAAGWSQPLPPMEAGTSLRIPLAARQEEMTSYIQVSALRISTDLGTEVWVPVVGVREDLKNR